MTNKKLKRSLSCFLAAPKIHNLKIVNRISGSSVVNLTRVGRAGPLGCKISNSFFDTGPCCKGQPVFIIDPNILLLILGEAKRARQG